MAITYKLPKIDQDQVVILATPVAGDTALANGKLAIKDEAGNAALNIKASDLLSFKYDAYAAGTANVVNVALASATLSAGGSYSLTVYAPNVQNFFGGGAESGAIYQTRTYVVSFAGGTGVSAPTAAQVATALVARINADTNAYFSAAVVSTSTVQITADSAGFGALVVTHNIPGTVTISDATAWVSPVGSADEVKGYVGNDLLVTGSQYNRYEINYRKVIRHNAVTGLQVIKPVTALVYLDKADAGTAAAVTLLTSILDGSYGTSYATLAKYCGCPAV
jgi:hypothetical protein